jgi:hypothetical protein
MPGLGWGLGFGVLHDPVVAFTNTAIAGMTGAFPGALRDAIYGRHAG